MYTTFRNREVIMVTNDSLTKSFKFLDDLE